MVFKDFEDAGQKSANAHARLYPKNDDQLYARVGKRTLDVFLTLLALPLILPLLGAIWVLGQFNGGQVFFAQDRVGRNGKVFRCLKVRTMVPDAEEVLKNLCKDDPEIAAEWDTYQKLQNDPRISRWGRFLRKTSIDELPQFFNVLAGDMSLVGPRPFMTCQTQIYLAGGGHHYFSMRPGITGSWQVDDRGDTSFLSRVHYDRQYYHRLSFGQDLRLLGRTAQVVLKRSGH